MRENNTKPTAQPALLSSLLRLLAAHRSLFGQERVYRRTVALAMGELWVFARHTLSQALLALGLEERDWSSWYRLFSRQRFSEEQAGCVLLCETLEHVEASAPYVVGCDATQIMRSSKTMPGTSWLKAPQTAAFKPGIQRGQRFVQGAWLTPLQAGESRAIPLRFLPALPDKAVAAPDVEPCREWAAGLHFLHWVRSQLDQAGRSQQLLLGLADGSYDVVELWRQLPQQTVLAVRTAKNRCLYALPQPHPGPGRPALYGERAPTPGSWLRMRQGWSHLSLLVRGRERAVRYRVEGPYVREGLSERPLFLIVVGGSSRLVGKRHPKRKPVKPCFYLVNAVEGEGGWTLPLPIEVLLAWLWQRWELEVAHREMKSGLGVGEMQCWSGHAALLSVQWSVWLYAILMLAGYRTWGVHAGPPALGRWRHSRRWSLSRLLQVYRSSLWQCGEFRTSCLPTLDNWPQIEHWLTGLDHVLASSSRL